MSEQAGGAERRRFVRFTTWVEVAYSVVDSSENLPAMARNLSAGGVGFFTKSRLTPGTVLNLELNLPNAPRAVKFTGEVAWSGPLLLFGQDDAPHAYETGVRILKIAPEDHQLLTRYRP